MSAADLVARLAQEGLDPSLLAEVAQELFTGEIERKALSDRRRNERDRKAKSREVTGQARTRRDTPPNEENNLTPPVLPNEASASLPIRQPVSAALECWNENARSVGWPVASTMSATRQRSLGARLREHGLDGWKNALAKARASPFLAGADPPSWFTFNWLIKSENFLKLQEGNYDQANRGSGGRLYGPRPDPTLALVRAATEAQREDRGDHGEARFALPSR